MIEMTESGYYSLITSFTGKKAEVARARIGHISAERRGLNTTIRMN
jgi:hypothetical protein